MAKQASTAMGAKKITVIADRGYFIGEEILACHEAGIVAIFQLIAGYYRNWHQPQATLPKTEIRCEK
jgi:hypothetical protein